VIKNIISILLLSLIFTHVTYALTSTEARWDDTLLKDNAALGATFQNSGGLSFPAYGMLRHNDAGEIIGEFGLNWTLGFSDKTYFKPVAFNRLNSYWHWGSVLAIIPYVGIGIDYIMDNGMYMGAGLVYVIPYLEFGWLF
jgi:hypothetical protein